MHSKRLVFCVLPLALSSPVAADTHAGFYGEWRGQAQFHAAVAGTPDPAAHAVTELALVIDSRGKVTSNAASNGCRMLGIASPSPNATMMNLDLTLSGCRYSALNRRFQGNIVLSTKDPFLIFKLVAHRLGSGQPHALFDVTATLRR